MTRARPDGRGGLHGLLHRHLPELEIRSVIPLGAGLDNTAWLVNDEIVVRQANQPDPGAIRRESALLTIVARYATLPVPEIIFTDPDAGILAYRVLPGTPLINLPHADTSLLAESLGTFLAAIHSIPLAGVQQFVPNENEPLQDWLDEAVESYDVIAGHLPASARIPIEAFLSERPLPDPDRLTFCHNDFGAEHILVDPTTMRITGIIDWTDAAIADPVRDFALILRDLGPTALDRALAAYGTPLTMEDRQRLLFHARCKLIEDIAYGIESGEARYFDAALAHLDWVLGQ